MQQCEVLAHHDDGRSASEEISSSSSGDQHVEGLAADGEVSRALTRIWQELLRVPDIQEADDFFDLGGDSLSAIRMLERIGREFGEELMEPDIIYTASSFGELKLAIVQALQAKAQAAEQP